MTKPTKPKTPPVPVAPTPTFEDGLIVGLLMGRGSFTGDRNQPRISILIVNDLEMLQWIKSRIGGTISGPHQDRTMQRYMWQLSGAALQPVIELLSAYMPTGLQRTKYLAWIERYWTKGRRIVNHKSRETA